MAESVNATLQYGSLVGNHGGRLGSPARDLGVRVPPQRARTQQVRGNPYPWKVNPPGCGHRLESDWDGATRLSFECSAFRQLQTVGTLPITTYSL